MKDTRLMMGMPITIEIVDCAATKVSIEEVFSYFEYIDNKFSTYKKDSEISLINEGNLRIEDSSDDMKTVFALSEKTKMETNEYFDINHNNRYDPSGLVKGWAILNAANIIKRKGFDNYYVEAGGDIQAHGKNTKGQDWRVGIRNPFNLQQIVKVVSIRNCGIATSGTYLRGQHIYNPKLNNDITEIVSLTVIGPNIYEADRFATAAFAMGKNGIIFIENIDGLEGYVIDKNGTATFTTGFEKYTL